MSDPIQSNAYAVAYRLLGERAAALAVAGIAAERVRQRFDEPGGLDVSQVPAENWLPMLIDYTVDQSVRTDVFESADETADRFAGLREALRRRLVRASRQERVIGALIHLCGYSLEDVCSMLDMEDGAVRTASRILAPPPGIDYRELGDPELIGYSPSAPARLPLPHWTTVIVAAALVVVLLIATQCHGPRPTLVEGALLGATEPVVELADFADAHLGEG